MKTHSAQQIPSKHTYTSSLRIFFTQEVLILSTSNVYVHGQYAQGTQRHFVNNTSFPARYSYIIIFLSTSNVPPHTLQHSRTCQHNMHFCLSTINAHVLVQQTCTSAVLAHHSCARPQVTWHIHVHLSVRPAVIVTYFVSRSNMQQATVVRRTSSRTRCRPAQFALWNAARGF